jgi:acetyl-CoA C-acetyltransferase
MQKRDISFPPSPLPGLPVSTVCTTVNKVCASGLKATTLGAQSLLTSQASVVVAGGAESMSNAPFYIPRVHDYGHTQALDSIVKDGLWDVYNQIHMGNCAEETADKHSITRADQDGHAVESYRRAAAAVKVLETSTLFGLCEAGNKLQRLLLKGLIF